MTYFQTQIGDSLVLRVRCRHRPRHGSDDHFPGPGTKTASELP